MKKWAFFLPSFFLLITINSCHTSKITGTKKSIENKNIYEYKWYLSEFSINENKIHFADPLKTMIFCEGGKEETFLNMLKKVNRYSVSDSVLTFLIGDVAVMCFGKK